MSLLSAMINKYTANVVGLNTECFSLYNRSLQYFVLFFFIFNLEGCYWPPPSTGGYAAHYPVKIKYSSCNPRDPFHQSLRAYYHLTRQLRVLQKSQVQRCYPARVREMTLLAQQIAEETAAGLFVSAAVDIELLENNIAAVWEYRFFTRCPKLLFNIHWLRLQSRIQ